MKTSVDEEDIMPQTYDYIRLVGLLAVIAGVGKVLLGLLGYSYGEHYLSSAIILAIGTIILIIGMLIKKNVEE